MTVEACIKAYRRVAAQAFTPKFGRILPGSPKGMFSAKALESAMKQVIRENCVETRCREQRSQGFPTGETCPHEGMAFYEDSSTKTYVPWSLHRVLRINQKNNADINRTES